MKHLRKNNLKLLPGESIVLSGQGFFKNNSRSGWRPGNLALTNRRLVLHQPTRNLFSTPLDAINTVATEKKGFILKSVDALSIGCANATDKSSERVWIVVKDPVTWQKGIFSRTKLKVSEIDLEKVSSELDSSSRKILLYVWDNQHATLQALAKLIEAENHWDVLNLIRNKINRISEKMVGYPMLVFERSMIDPITNQKVLFSWWIIGAHESLPVQKGHDRIPDFDQYINPLIDIFEEKEHVIVLIEINGVQQEEILTGITDTKLKLHCNSKRIQFSEDLLLPCKVDAETIEKNIAHGIVEIRMKKVKVDQ